MASEIRANKQTNRVGLGTVTYTDTGIIVSGIVTANSFKGDGSSLTGIDATALKDSAGAVKIQANISGAVHSGVSTFTDDVYFDGATAGRDIVFDRSDNQLEFAQNAKAYFGGAYPLTIYNNINSYISQNPNAALFIESKDVQIYGSGNGYNDAIFIARNGIVELGYEPSGGSLSTQLKTSAKGITVGTGVTIETNGQATYTGIVTASAFKLSDGTAVGGLQQTNTLNFGGAVSIINTGAHDLNLSITDQGSIKFRTETDSGGGDGWDIDPFGNFIPHVNDGNNIGSSSKRVKYIYSDEVFANKFIVQSTIVPNQDSLKDIGSNSVRFRNAYVDNYYGDGSNLSNLPAGAPVGGASTNTVFFENDKEVAVNYQITSTKNAMTAGPVSINVGIAVTVPSGCAWTIV